MKRFRIAIDFDGTIVEHKYPDIGKPVPGAFEWLKRWQEAGAMLILWTMRSDSDKEGSVLSDAVEFCRKHGIEFDGVNEGPGDREWTTSPKVYAHRYVDDAAEGCPLVRSISERPYVDWMEIGPSIAGEIKSYNGRWAPNRGSDG